MLKNKLISIFCLSLIVLPVVASDDNSEQKELVASTVTFDDLSDGHAFESFIHGGHANRQARWKAEARERAQQEEQRFMAELNARLEREEEEYLAQMPFYRRWTEQTLLAIFGPYLKDKLQNIR